MAAPAFWLLTSIYSLLLGQLGGFVTIEHVESNRIEFFQSDSVYVVAKASTTCYGGERALIRLPRTASFQTQLHELAHAYDCKDNGVMDGSPLAGNAWINPDWPRCHIEVDRGYACWAARGMGLLEGPQ